MSPLAQIGHLAYAALVLATSAVSRWRRAPIGLAAILGALALIAAFGAARAEAADELTPVIGNVVTPPQQVLAADGRRHLAYELQLTNRSSAKVTIRRIDVLAGKRVVGSMNAKRVAGMMLPFGAPQPGNVLQAGQSSFVLMDVSFPRTGKLPARIVQRLRVSMKPADPSTVSRYLTAPTRVIRRPAVVVAPPLRGAGWVVGNGCCGNFNAHRGAVLPVNGALHVAERFAIDFVQLDAARRMFTGPKDMFSSYGFFGDDILSATAGRVVGKVDNLADTPAGGFPKGITAAQAGGNHVVVDMGRGRFAFYAHIQPGSITVNVGDRVQVGQTLGLLGNSGNSDAPHLHFHVMDSPSPLASNSVPYRFSRFTGRGLVANIGPLQDGAVADIVPGLGGEHVGELPMDNELIDFDG